MTEEIKTPTPKGTTFIVEIIKKEDDSRLYVIRDPRSGIPLQVLDSANDVATFFDEVTF